MYASRIRAAGLAVAAALGLSACTTYGGGLGYGGYGGLSVGVSSGYYDGYGYPGYGYSGYGYGYGYPGYSYG